MKVLSGSMKRSQCSLFRKCLQERKIIINIINLCLQKLARHRRQGESNPSAREKDSVALQSVRSIESKDLNQRISLSSSDNQYTWKLQLFSIVQVPYSFLPRFSLFYGYRVPKFFLPLMLSFRSNFQKVVFKLCLESIFMSFQTYKLINAS